MKIFLTRDVNFFRISESGDKSSPSIRHHPYSLYMKDENFSYMGCEFFLSLFPVTHHL